MGINNKNKLNLDTLKNVAELTHSSIRTVQRRIASGEYIAYKNGRKVLVDVDSVYRALGKPENMAVLTYQNVRALKGAEK